jgi:hypothetical protein
MTEQSITAEAFDRKFERGEDTSDYIDWRKAKRPGTDDLAKMVAQLRETKNHLLAEARRIEETLTALENAL